MTAEQSRQAKTSPNSLNRVITLLVVAGAAALLVYPPWAAVAGRAAVPQQQRQLLHVPSRQKPIICPWGNLQAHKDAWRPALLRDPKPRTELLSFPGSGNSWVRYLIETSTGYRTNSIYHCNVQNYLPEIAADCNKWNYSIVTKSHNFNCEAKWESAIVLLRNPLHAIRAEYQRAKTWNQTAVIDQQDWNWDDWYKVADKKCTKWTQDHAEVLGLPPANDGNPAASTTGCARHHRRTMHVFFYEDFKTPSGALNPQFLQSLLASLGINKQDAYFDCAVALSEGEYHRSYPIDPSHPAVQVLSDARTLQIMRAAGCLNAYEAYKQHHASLGWL